MVELAGAVGVRETWARDWVLTVATHRRDTHYMKTNTDMARRLIAQPASSRTVWCEARELGLGDAVQVDDSYRMIVDAITVRRGTDSVVVELVPTAEDMAADVAVYPACTVELSLSDVVRWDSDMDEKDEK